MRNCDYSVKYYDYERRGYTIFECPHDAVPNVSKCKFHDELYSRKNIKDFWDSFYELVKSSVKSKKPLYCIGFIFTNGLALNTITFPNKVFFAHAYFQDRTVFNNITFSDDANFFNATFLKEAVFNAVEFNALAYFSDAIFVHEAVFNAVEFNALAYFSDAIFVHEAVFNNVEFKKLANFPNARFKGEATFNAVDFQELANFNNTAYYQDFFINTSGLTGNDIYMISNAERSEPSTRNEFMRTLVNSSPQADISLYIYEKNSATEYEYDVLARGFNYDLAPIGRIKFRSNPKATFSAKFQDIETANEAPMVIDNRMRSKGRRLYDQLFSPDLKSLYWNVRDKVRTFHVLSDEPWIPWEIIKPWRKTEDGKIEEDPYLCESFGFSRWQRSTRVVSKDVINKINLVIPSDTKLESSIYERDWIKEFGKDKELEISVSSSYEEVLSTLQNGESDLIHFSTHAGTSNEDPLLSYIEVEDGQQIRCEDIGGEYGNFGQSHPVIIFNACKTGSQDFSLTDIQGWVTTFLNAGASAFIGTLWSVSDEASFDFIKELYRQLSLYETLDESVRRARINCRKSGDPSWLAYELYVRPNTHLLFGSK